MMLSASHRLFCSGTVLSPVHIIILNAVCTAIWICKCWNYTCHETWWSSRESAKEPVSICLNIGIRILFFMPLLCFKKQQMWCGTSCPFRKVMPIIRMITQMAKGSALFRIFFKVWGIFVFCWRTVSKENLDCLLLEKTPQSLWSDNQTGKYNWFAAFKRSWSDQSCNSGTQRGKKKLTCLGKWAKLTVSWQGRKQRREMENYYETNLSEHWP